VKKKTVVLFMHVHVLTRLTLPIEPVHRAANRAAKEPQIELKKEPQIEPKKGRN
jgi:hypothetical protein